MSCHTNPFRHSPPLTRGSLRLGSIGSVFKRESQREPVVDDQAGELCHLPRDMSNCFTGTASINATGMSKAREGLDISSGNGSDVQFKQAQNMHLAAWRAPRRSSKPNFQWRSQFVGAGNRWLSAAYLRPQGGAKAFEIPPPRSLPANEVCDLLVSISM
jgi:hypothetical protein